MGLFDRFKKQDCEICGKEVGMFGYKKLEDGEICKDCVKLLSPWFEDRRHATVAQIKEQLAYRAANEQALENFRVAKVIGKNHKMYIEEVGGVPTRFVVSLEDDHKKGNPDIISFADVMSCDIDIDVRDEEIMKEGKDGQEISYVPPRFKHDYDFYITMSIANNPYFSSIRFKLNTFSVTLETIGGMGGIGGMALSSMMGRNVPNGARINLVSGNGEQRRYQEFCQMCEEIKEIVEQAKDAKPAAPQAAGPKFCPNCGAPTEGSKFCQNCGTKL